MKSIFLFLVTMFHIFSFIMNSYNHFLNCAVMVNYLDSNLGFLDLNHSSAVEYFSVPELLELLCAQFPVCNKRPS